MSVSKLMNPIKLADLIAQLGKLYLEQENANVYIKLKTSSHEYAFDACARSRVDCIGNIIIDGVDNY